MITKECAAIVNDLLDLVAKKADAKSDYALAKYLGWQLQTLRNYRMGKTKPNDTACMELAEQLREDPLRLMAKIKLEDAHTQRERTVWSKYAGRVLLAALVITGTPLEGNAQKIVKAIDQDIHYAHIGCKGLIVMSHLGQLEMSHPGISW